jgi:hypothetical protein
VRDVKLDAELIGEQPYRRAPFDDGGLPVAVNGWRRRGIELVLDLADDLLEDVLEGDQPDRRAVLVEPRARDARGCRAQLEELGGHRDVEDRNGAEEPDDPYLARKVTFWESNGQITRRVRIPAG